jgi:hypothetical protein
MSTEEFMRVLHQRWRQVLRVAVGAGIVTAAGAPATLAQQSGQQQPRQADTESTSASARERCVANKAAVEAAVNRPGDSNAIRGFRDIRDCDETGPTALISAWRMVPVSRSSVGALLSASSTLRDGRLEREMLSILGDSLAPSLLRQAAAVVLVSYVDPSFGGKIERSPFRKDSLGVGITRSMHVIQKDGAQPVAPGLSSRLRPLLKRAAGDDHPALAELAKALLGMLKA